MLNFIDATDGCGGPKWLLWLCQWNPKYILVSGDTFDDALEELGSWVVDNAPEHLIDNIVEEIYQDALARGLTEEEAQQEAELDATLIDGGHYLSSSEWGIELEHPTPEELTSWLTD